MTKKSFIMYFDLCAVFDELTDEQAGQLIKEIANYAKSKTEDNQKKPSGLFGLLNAVFTPFKNHIDRDFEAWNEKANIARENGKNGGRPRLKETDNNLKKAVKVNVNVNASVKDNVNASDDLFAEFWLAYPRKTSKLKAASAYAKAIKKINHADLMAKLKTFNFSHDPQFIPHAATWLNGERWKDEPLATNRPNNQPPVRTSQGSFADERRKLLGDA